MILGISIRCRRSSGKYVSVSQGALMATGSSCPAQRQLEDYLRGALPAVAAQALAAHVQSCSSCQSAVRRIHSAQPETRPVEMRTPSPVQPHVTAAPTGPTVKPDSFAFLRPPEAPDEIGRLGDYRVLRFLDKGGMALVFHAEDVTLRRSVALKVMKPDLDADMEGWQRFLREARMMAAIHHEHLVTIYQAGQQGEIGWFAMELLQGESLDRFLERVSRPEIRDVIRIGREIAAGLAFIHKNGFIHRDLKPGNIWLSTDRVVRAADLPDHATVRVSSSAVGKVKILDLGLARPVKEDVRLTQTGLIVGTPAFMSPEQARGAALDARSDLFSLGCILYCLCAGTKPFDGETTMAVLTALAVDKPRSIRQQNPEVPEALAALVMRLLAKDPPARPASADEVIAALEQLEGTLPGTGRPSSQTRALQPIGARPSLPRWLVFGLIFGLPLAAFLGILVVVLAASGPKKSQPILAQATTRSQPATKPVAKGKQTFLVELPEGAMREGVYFPKDLGKKGMPLGAGGKKKDKDPIPHFEEFVFQGKPVPHGIGMHPSPKGAASVTYQLNKRFKTFRAQVTQNEGPPEESNPAMIFVVYLDNVEKKASRQIKSTQDLDQFNLNVEGAKELRLEVKAAAAGMPMAAEGLWVEPVLEE